MNKGRRSYWFVTVTPRPQPKCAGADIARVQRRPGDGRVNVPDSRRRNPRTFALAERALLPGGSSVGSDMTIAPGYAIRAPPAPVA
jgi:hypothetical protein